MYINGCVCLCESHKCVSRCWIDRKLGNQKPEHCWSHHSQVWHPISLSACSKRWFGGGKAAQISCFKIRFPEERSCWWLLPNQKLMDRTSLRRESLQACMSAQSSSDWTSIKLALSPSSAVFQVLIRERLRTREPSKPGLVWD